MRRFLGLLLLPALALPAWAEPPLKDAPTHRHVRQTWQEHFAEANIAHDGHLTAEEAKGGFKVITRHFDDIDIEHKGYVTQNDVRAWRVMRKAAQRLSKPQEDKLRPRDAFQRGRPDAKPVNTSGRQTMAVGTGLQFTRI
jgi:hypothetical protein